MKYLLLALTLFSTLFADIRAVVFDFGGVICEANRSRLHGFVCSSLGVSKEEAVELVRELHEGVLDIDEFWLHKGYSQEYAERFTQVSLSCIQEVPGTLPIAKDLKKRGLRVGLLSNVTPRVAKLIDVSGYYEGFDPLILSTEIGVRKPDPEAYRIMLKKLGLKPHEVLFIDDRIENIAAARALGIETHHFESSSKLKRSCIKLGLLEEERVEFDEHSIWVESLGSPKDPAILLIAGAGCHAHFWTDELVQELVSEGYFVIRYDQRDTGLSTPFPRSYILEDLADDAVMILDHFGYEQAHVVGHSMGGYVGQLLAARYPNVVTSLTVVGAGPAFETADTKKPLNEQEKRTLGGYFKLVFANRPNESFAESLPKFITVWEHSNGSYPLDIAMVTSYVDELYNRTLHSFSMSHHHLEAMEEILHGLDKRGSVPQMITMPTLVIQGGQDPLVLPHRGGIALYKALPQAELKLFPKMGHMLFNRQLEEQFIDTLKEFLYGI